MNCQLTCSNKQKKCSICKRAVDTNLDFYEETIDKVKGKGNVVYRNGIRAERKIVSKFGGRRILGSGSLSGQFIGLSGDVVIPKYNLLIQSKTKTKRSKDDNKINIQKEWLDKHWHQAGLQGRIPALFFSFIDKIEFWAIHDADIKDEYTFVKTNSRSITISREDLAHCPLYFKFPEDSTIYCIVSANQFLDSLEVNND